MWAELLLCGVGIFLLLNIKGMPGSYHLMVGWITFTTLLFDKKKINPLEGATLHFRVWPDDLDIYLHMNNSVYHKQADYGRYYLLTKMGVMGYARKEKVEVHNGGQFIQFRKALSPFQSYSLVSRIHSFDEKWIYIEQTFNSKGRAHAVKYVKLVVKKGRETIPPSTALSHMGHSSLLPLLSSPSPLSSLFQSFDALH